MTASAAATRTGTSRSGWCMEGKHGPDCHYGGCSCRCHAPDGAEVPTLTTDTEEAP